MSPRYIPRRIGKRPLWGRTDRLAVIIALAASLIATGVVIVYGVLNGNAANESPPPAPVMASASSSPPTPFAPEIEQTDKLLQISPTDTPDGFVIVGGGQHGPMGNKPVSALGPITIRPTDTVILKDVTRFGLNIGGRSIYGAAQHLKNLVPNPGFESGVFGSMIHVAKGATTARVPQAFWDTDWTREDYGIGQPNGFWDGGEYEFMFGAAKGRKGRITQFALEAHENVFYLDGGGATPNEWDVLAIRRDLPGIAAGPRMSTECVSTDVRPGSPGTQSLHLQYGRDPSKYELYMDSEWRDGDKSAGKLMVVRGDWKVSFWAKGKGIADRVRVMFHREGEGSFIDESIRLSPDWQLIERTFSVPDGKDKLGPYSEGDYHALLVLSVSLETEGQAWLDDLTLEPAAEKNSTVFTDAFVNRLKELRPGVLRDWSVQHGDTLDNQLTEPFARKTCGYSPKQRAANEWGFSLHEFLQLCNEVGAEPWYVMPPMWSEHDVRGLMEYLATPADGQHPFADRRAKLGQSAPWTEVFKRIHIEFGNEMWGEASANDPFFGASALGGERLGKMANERFTMLRESQFFNQDKINLIIGGQFYYPGRQGEIDATGNNHREIALAPYFGDDKNHANDEELFYPMFARPFEDVETGRMKLSQDELDKGGKKTGLAIYEINFHTTGGEAPIDSTNDFVTGAGGALALPLYMLVYQRDMGAKNQCAFTALQFSFGIGDNRYVRVWGLLRDIAATARKRPTWLGLELVNRVIQGDMVAVDIEGERTGWTQKPINSVENEITVPYVHAFAYKSGSTRSLILFNLNLTATASVAIDLGNANGSVTRHQIAPKSLRENNEDAENVTIDTDTIALPSPLSIDLPAHSLTALAWSLP
ncbi:MAG: hypothetical protein IT366_05905 [Candidatus Hydrogenedentes bacterium]|nr:hypothetical protein [Candidatus Hydrogenedentota bacterium]